MLNECHVEGKINRVWRFGNTRFVRISCYPDPGRTLKPGGNGRSPAEFITLRFEPPKSREAALFKEGQLIRASGYLSSRDYDISLASFGDKATGDEKALAALKKLSDKHGDSVQKPHVLNEIVVERCEPVRGP